MWFLVAPGFSIRPEVVPSGLQAAPGGSRLFQVASGSFRYFQVLPGAFRGLQSHSWLFQPYSHSFPYLESRPSASNKVHIYCKKKKQMGPR